MKVTALAPWFGSARMIAEHVGEAMKGCRWVLVPFAGGMSELRCIDAPSMLVNDKHKWVINLARVVATSHGLREISRRLNRTPFHPDSLSASQKFCLTQKPEREFDVEAAFHYFVSQWMGRSGNAGTDGEFKGKLSTRWNGNGGDSNTRFRSAGRSLVDWHRIMRRCNFSTEDAFDCIKIARERSDSHESGIYIDAPWPDDGDDYVHKFDRGHQVSLKVLLESFIRARIVVRYGDHPLIRELYDERYWEWQFIDGRTQANKTKREVLLIRKRGGAKGLFGDSQ